MDKNKDIVRERLGRHGLGSEVSELVELWTSEDPSEESGMRGNIAIGYVQNGKRRETAMVSLPSIDDAVTLLEDRDRLAGLLSLGIGAMPATRRPVVPHWITQSEDARRTRRDMARAGRLADDAAEGRTVDTANDAAAADGTPF